MIPRSCCAKIIPDSYSCICFFLFLLFCVWVFLDHNSVLADCRSSPSCLWLITLLLNVCFSMATWISFINTLAAFSPRWLMGLTLTRMLHCTPRLAGKCLVPNYSALHRLQSDGPWSCLIKGCYTLQDAVRPPLVHPGQISSTPLLLCVGHRVIITITIIISGSFCADTELHWDPFYLAENKQKNVSFSTTRGCFCLQPSRQCSVHWRGICIKQVSSLYNESCCPFSCQNSHIIGPEWVTSVNLRLLGVILYY